MRFALVVSQFNKDVTDGLFKGAMNYLREVGVGVDSVEVFSAPGAFEAPVIAKKLAATKRFDGVICLGCVIKGDTAHFEFISLGATVGIMQAMLATDTPVSFGIITTYTDEQAVARSREDAHNKGREAAAACFETARTLQSIC